MPNVRENDIEYSDSSITLFYSPLSNREKCNGMFTCLRSREIKANNRHVFNSFKTGDWQNTRHEICLN